MSERKAFAQRVYERAGFSTEHATQLSNIFSVVERINNRLVLEGKPDLFEVARQLEEKKRHA